MVLGTVPRFHEAFLHPEHPLHARFASLTRQEEKHGLPKKKTGQREQALMGGDKLRCALSPPAPFLLLGRTRWPRRAAHYNASGPGVLPPGDWATLGRSNPALG